jgi:alpha 1,3-glucosidase
MNEPSVFNGPEVTMPRDAIHPNGNVEHRDVHNMYGYYVHRATFEGLEKRVPGDRAFVLTRSFFVGSHKYAAIWTGDNYAKWEHLQASIAMVGALAVGGQSLVGADVGGFFKHPDSEMAVRWYQLAVLAYPFLRNHAHLETPRREPYTFDEATMLLVKTSLQLRYKMLPFWYTLFKEYSLFGSPVVRPLFWDFLEDPMTHSDANAVENQIMLGKDVLVHGITKPLAEGGDATTVYLPRSSGWYDLHTGAYYASGASYDLKVTLESIPAYYRAGAILPFKSRIRRSSSCMHFDPFTLGVYLDPKTGTATGHVYLDDYKTLNYTDGKSFLDVQFEFKDGVLKASGTSGALSADVAAEIERVEIFGLTKPVNSAMSSGSKLTAVSRKIESKGAGAPGTLYASTVKVAPWIDMRKLGWQLLMA